MEKFEDVTTPDDALSDWSVGLTWYLNPNARFMFNYVLAALDRGGTSSKSHILQIRTQVFF